jgi:hypothetical protein
VASIVNTFENLKKYAKWDAVPEKKEEVKVLTPAEVPEFRQVATNGSGLNLSYTINLNLPETSDVEVFNAIFRSLKENLLRG